MNKNGNGVDWLIHRVRVLQRVDKDYHTVLLVYLLLLKLSFFRLHLDSKNLESDFEFIIISAFNLFNFEIFVDEFQIYRHHFQLFY